MSTAKIGDYTITRMLGQGGMGKVFEGLSPQGATVAIKTMLLAEGLDARTRWETVERFQREARAARSLVHPNIVQVLDIGADQETFFIVMEFLDGQSVGQLVDLAGAVRVERAVEIMIPACEALAYAHDQGVVHRDIKPDNIMVLRNGTVKVTDFGLASIVAERGVTQTGTVMGTFAYMSPEQAKGEKLDARSDIFSLGVSFWEMLSGHPPFQGETAVVLNKLLHEEPPAISGLPPHITRTLNKCLRKQPEYRFQNAREIITSLRTPTVAAETTGTVVLRRPTPAPSPTPGGTGQGAPAKPGGSPGRPAPQPTPGPTVYRCQKCREPMNKNASSCWKCGTPNPLMAERTQHDKFQREMLDALRGTTAPPKKGGWWKKGK